MITYLTGFSYLKQYANLGIDFGGCRGIEI